jgi:hypothetical protein
MSLYLRHHRRAERPIVRIKVRERRAARIQLDSKLALLCLRNNKLLRQVLLVRARARARGLRCLLDIRVSNVKRVRDRAVRMDEAVLRFEYVAQIATLRPGKRSLYHRGHVKVMNRVWFRVRDGETMGFRKGVLYLKKLKPKIQRAKQQP